MNKAQEALTKSAAQAQQTETELQQLQLQLADLQKEHAHVERERFEEIERIMKESLYEKADLNKKIFALQSELEDTKAALKMDASGLQRELEKVVHERQLFLQDKEAMAASDSLLLDTKKDCDRLRKELQRMTSDSDIEIHEYKTKLAGMQRMQKEAERKATADTAAKEKEIHELKLTVTNFERDMNVMRLKDSEIEQLKSNVADLNKELQKHVALARNLLDEETAARDEGILKLQTHCSALQKQLADADRKFADEMESMKSKQEVLKEENARHELEQLNRDLATDVVVLKSRSSKLELISENMLKRFNDSNYTGLHLIFSLWAVHANSNMKKRLRGCNMISAMEFKSLVSDFENNKIMQKVSFADDEGCSFTGNLQTARMWHHPHASLLGDVDGQITAMPPLEMSGRGGVRFKTHIFNQWRKSCTSLLLIRNYQACLQRSHETRVVRRIFNTLVDRARVCHIHVHFCRVVCKTKSKGFLRIWHKLAGLSGQYGRKLAHLQNISVATRRGRILRKWALYAQRSREVWAHVCTKYARTRDMCLLGRMLDLWVCVLKIENKFAAKLTKDKEEVERVWAVQAETERQKTLAQEILINRSAQLLDEGFIAMFFASWRQHTSKIIIQNLVQTRERESIAKQDSYDKRLEKLEDLVDQLTSARDEAQLQCSYLEAALDAAVEDAQEKEAKISDQDLTIDAALEDTHAKEQESSKKVADLEERVRGLQIDLIVKQKELLHAQRRESDYNKRIAPLTASLDATIEESRARDTDAKNKIKDLTRELELESRALANQTEALQIALSELDRSSVRTTELAATLEESTLLLREARRIEEESNLQVGELTSSNKSLKREFEHHKSSLQQELNQATRAIAKLREERDAAVQRELQLSMQRHATTSRPEHFASSSLSTAQAASAEAALQVKLRSELDLTRARQRAAAKELQDTHKKVQPVRQVLPGWASAVKLLAEKAKSGTLVLPNDDSSSSDSDRDADSDDGHDSAQEWGEVEQG